MRDLKYNYIWIVLVRREKWLLPLFLLLSRCLFTWNCKLQIAFSAVGLIKILRHESANLYQFQPFEAASFRRYNFWQSAKINWDLRYGRESGDAPNRDNVIKSSLRDTNAPGSFLSSRIDLLLSAILCPQFLSPYIRILSVVMRGYQFNEDYF